MAPDWRHVSLMTSSACIECIINSAATAARAAADDRRLPRAERGGDEDDIAAVDDNNDADDDVDVHPRDDVKAAVSVLMIPLAPLFCAFACRLSRPCSDEAAPVAASEALGRLEMRPPLPLSLVLPIPDVVISSLSTSSSSAAARAPLLLLLAVFPVSMPHSDERIAELISEPPLPVPTSDAEHAAKTHRSALFTSSSPSEYSSSLPSLAFTAADAADGPDAA